MLLARSFSVLTRISLPQAERSPCREASSNIIPCSSSIPIDIYKALPFLQTASTPSQTPADPFSSIFNSIIAFCSLLFIVLMGNYVSCTLSNAHASHSKGPRVVLPGGEIRQLSAPASAAELMLDNPSHFLVSTKSMRIGCRFMALSADEELEAGEVYAMFPMKRVNSVITAADMGVLLMATNSVVRRASGGKARVIPDNPQALAEPSPQVEEIPVPRLKLEEVVDDLSVGEFKYRLSLCRSRRPLLETIAEETAVCSR